MWMRESCGSAVGEPCHHLRLVIERRKMFFETCARELVAVPFYQCFLGGIDGGFAHAEHFRPAEPGNCALGVAVFVDPARASFDKEMAALFHVLFEGGRLVIGHHQGIGKYHQLVFVKIASRQFSGAQNVNGNIPFEEHAVVACQGFVHGGTRVFFVVTAEKRDQGAEDDCSFGWFWFCDEEQILVDSDLLCCFACPP